LAAESADDADATRIARILYEKGLESFLWVLDAERALYAAGAGLAQSERDAGSLDNWMQTLPKYCTTLWSNCFASPRQT
jgi:hypothetical protein